MSTRSNEKQMDINELWNEKIQKLSGKVRAIARGDEDLYQEGIIGIREGILRDPDATDSYLLQAAKFAMTNYKNRGKSVDNGSRHPTTRKLLDGTVKTYKKDMIPIYDYELGYSHPPDILAIDRICAEKFYHALNEDEALLVAACIHALGGRNSGRRRIKQSVYEKFIRAFGTDEEVSALEELEELALAD